MNDNIKNVKENTLGKDSLLLTISNFMVSVIGIITSMLLARFRTLSEYGTYHQIISITDLVSTIFLLGLPSSVNYFLANSDTEEEKQKFLTLYLVLSTIITAVIGMCLFLSIPLIVSYYNNPYISTFAYIFAVYPWASIVINSLSNVCVVYKKSNKLIIFNIVHVLVNLIILIISQILKLGFQIYTALYIFSMLIFAIFSLCWMIKIVGKLNFSFSWNFIKDIFIYAIPIGLSSAVGTLNGELDKLLIGRFFTTEEYSIYVNASKVLPVTILATSLTTVLLPKFIELLKNNKTDKVISIWGSSINISFGIICLIVGGLIVFAPDVMSLFYSQKYITESGVAVFRIYTLIILFRATYWGIILNAMGKTKFIFFSSIATLILNCIGNIAFYYLFDFLGPALSSLMSKAVISFFQLIITCKLLKVSIIKIFPWKQIGIFLLQTILIGSLFYILKVKLLGGFTSDYSIIISIILGIIWSVIYLLINIKIFKYNWSMLNEAPDAAEK